MSGEPGRSGSQASGVQDKIKARGPLSTEEQMLLNCSAGEDSWESPGLRGDQPVNPEGKKKKERKNEKKL